MPQRPRRQNTTKTDRYFGSAAKKPIAKTAPSTSGRHIFCRGGARGAPQRRISASAKSVQTLPTGVAMGLAGALLSRRRPEMP